MNFNDLFENCPTPMLITNSEGIILESNARTRELAGFKSKKEGTEVYYSEQPCDISAFSEDFMLIITQSELKFIILLQVRGKLSLMAMSMY